MTIIERNAHARVRERREGSDKVIWTALQTQATARCINGAILGGRKNMACHYGLVTIFEHQMREAQTRPP